MINVILQNSESRVIGLNDKELMKLRKAVCYFNMSLYVRTKNVHAATTFLIDGDGFFPTGLMPRVQEWLRQNHYMTNVVDNRVAPRGHRLNLVQMCEEPPAYPEQLEAARIMASNVSGTVEMPTGIGKTRTIKELISLISRPTLVVTPSSNLKFQMHDYLVACFGKRFVGTLGDPQPIIVTNYHSIASHDPRYFDRFDVLVFDEYHNAANNTIREVNATHFGNIYHKYGLTATNFKNDEHEGILLECVLSNQLYSVSTVDAMNRGYIVPVVPTFHKLTNQTIFSSGKYAEDYKKFMDLNQERNGIAIEGARKMVQHNLSTLVLVEHVEHGRLIADSIPGAVFVNGQDNKASWNMEQIRLFNEKKIPAIVGTSVIGEGVDTKAAQAVYNLSGGKARSELLQKVGRVVRRFPGKKVGFYFDFTDEGQKHLVKHARSRLAIIENTYAVKVRTV